MWTIGSAQRTAEIRFRVKSYFWQHVFFMCHAETAGGQTNAKTCKNTLGNLLKSETSCLSKLCEPHHWCPIAGTLVPGKHHQEAWHWVHLTFPGRWIRRQRAFFETYNLNVFDSIPDYLVSIINILLYVWCLSIGMFGLATLVLLVWRHVDVLAQQSTASGWCSAILLWLWKLAQSREAQETGNSPHWHLPSMCEYMASMDQDIH